MKIHLLISGLLIVCVLITCDQVRYNSVDVTEDTTTLGVDTPLDLYATKGYLRDSVYISWVYSSLSSLTFTIYRSQNETSGFIELETEITATSYYDESALPGKVYYYKVKAISLLYGESEFSEVVEGYRAGRGTDAYELVEEGSGCVNVDFSSLYERSIYPENDFDYYEVDCDSGDFIEIDILKTSDSYSNISYFDLYFYDNAAFSGTPYKSFAAKTLSTVIRKAVASSGPLYIKITPEKLSSTQELYSTATGDYDFQVVKLDASALIKNSTASGSYCSYVRLSWKTDTLLSYYQIQRKKTGETAYSTISVSTSLYRRDTLESVTGAPVYDLSPDQDTEYQYKIIGYTSDGVMCSSASATGIRRSISADGDESDNTFATAGTLVIDTAQTHTIEPMGDIDYYQIDFETGKTYTITATPANSALVTVTLSLFDPDQNLLIYNTPDEDDESSMTGWICPAAGTYYLKAEAFTLTGTYTINVADVTP